MKRREKICNAYSVDILRSSILELLYCIFFSSTVLGLAKEGLGTLDLVGMAQNHPKKDRIWGV